MSLNIAGLVNSSNISAENKLKVLEATCTQFGYKDILVGVNGEETPNPETKIQFFNKIWTQRIRDVVLRVEGNNSAINTMTTLSSSLDM